MDITDAISEETQVPSMEQLLEDESCTPLQRGEIREGEVIAIWPAYIVMDIQAKREGFVPKRDLDRLDAEVRERVEVGVAFPVYVLQPEDVEGRTIVSISRGLVQEDWNRAHALLENQEIWESEVVGYNRGGLLVEFGRLRGFVPASHVVGFPRSLPPEQKRQRLSEWVGRQLGLRVIEVHQRRNRLVLSERAAYREYRNQQIERLFDELQQGQIVQGHISSLCDFGSFVDLGGVDGLIHISEISWKRIDHPREVLRVGEEVEVRVIRLDRQRRRISLSLRQAMGDPWARVEERYTLGQLVTGKVTRIVSYGAFVELEEGLEGLLHISELSDDPVTNPRDILEEGEALPLRVIRIDPSRRRLGLSFRRVTTEEWEEWRAERLRMEPPAPPPEEALPVSVPAEPGLEMIEKIEDMAVAEPPAEEETEAPEETPPTEEDEAAPAAEQDAAAEGTPSKT